MRAKFMAGIQARFQAVKAGMAEAQFNVTEAVLGAAGFIQGIASNNLFLTAVGGGMVVSKAAATTMLVLSKRHEKLVEQTNKLSENLQVSFPTDRRSHIGTKKPTDLNYLVVLGGALLKGPGESVKPLIDIQSSLEGRSGKEVETLEMATAGSRIDNIPRQMQVANDFLGSTPFKGGKINAILAEVGHDNASLGTPYNIEESLRPILGEYTVKNGIRNVVEGGAKLVLVPPNAFKNVVSKDESNIPEEVLNMRRRESNKAYNSLVSAINRYKKNNPKLAENVVILPRQESISYSRENGFFLNHEQLQELNANATQALAPAFIEKPPLSVNIQAHSGLVRVRQSGMVGAPPRVEAIEPMMTPEEPGYGQALAYAKSVQVAVKPDGSLDIKEPPLDTAQGTIKAPPQLRIMVTAPPKAHVTVRTIDADIRTTGTFEYVETSTAAGKTIINDAGLFFGSSETGSIKLTSTNYAAIDTRDGEVQVGVVAKDCLVKTATSDVSIEEVNGNCRLDTNKGNLTIGQVSGGFRADAGKGTLSWKSVGTVVKAEGRIINKGREDNPDQAAYTYVNGELMLSSRPSGVEVPDSLASGTSPKLVKLATIGPPSRTERTLYRARGRLKPVPVSLLKS